MTVNIPLLRKVLEHITAHPAEWNQRNWGIKDACGTAYCVAGHTVVMTGVELAWRRHRAVDEYGPPRAEYTADGRLISDVAAEALGLDRTAADHLFYSENTLADVWRMANHYTNGEIVPPPQLADT